MPHTDPRWPQGYGYQYFERVTSTMDVAREAIEQAQTGPLWIQARHQSQGRGRRSKAWQDPEGNLIATLILPQAGRTAQELSLISFVAALGVHGLCHELLGETEQVALKWPNDVLVNIRKVSGILLENHAARALAIGIGINAAAQVPNADPQSRFEPISLAQVMQKVPDSQTLMVILAHHFDHWLRRFDGEGFAAIRASWLQHAFMPQDPIVARLPNEEVQGYFEGINEEGCLLLRTNAGLRQIAAGDIYW